MIQALTALLNATAWPMTEPRPYSLFHLALAVPGILLAVLLAKRLARSDRDPCRVLFLTGLLLAASELYKQAFLYLIEDGGRYDWWYFPFQLCSVPMYLCLLLPLFARKTSRAARRVRECFYTFLQDFGLLGGVMAVAVPDGLMHPYWTMTLHGFLWHFTLIFLALYCAWTGLGGRSRTRYLQALPLFALCCLAATVINIAAHPYGNADMFYINPYYPNGQLVFHQISLAIGTLAGNLIYLLAVIAGGAVCHLAAGRLNPRGGGRSH